MGATRFVFKKVQDETTAGLYQLTAKPDTLSELKKYLNGCLKAGFNAEDFFIIRGRAEMITAVKVIAEFETVET